MLEYKLFRGSLYIRLIGELDQSATKLLRERIDALISSDNFDKVIFDMSGLSFMDSAGVGLIMGRYKILRSKNKMIAIRQPSPPVDKVLNVSGIYSIIPKIQ